MSRRRGFHHFRRFGYDGGRRRKSSRRRPERSETEKNSKEQDHLHHLSTPSVRKGFRKNAIPRRFHQGGIGDAIGFERSQSSSKHKEPHFYYHDRLRENSKKTSSYDLQFGIEIKRIIDPAIGRFRSESEYNTEEGRLSSPNKLHYLI